MYYYLQSFFVEEIFNSSFQSTTINNLPLFTLRNLKLLLPSVSEQIKIKQFLDSSEEQMDTCKKITEQQITQ